MVSTPLLPLEEKQPHSIIEIPQTESQDAVESPEAILFGDDDLRDHPPGDSELNFVLLPVPGPEEQKLEDFSRQHQAGAPSIHRRERVRRLWRHVFRSSLQQNKTREVPIILQKYRHSDSEIDDWQTDRSAFRTIPTQVLAHIFGFLEIPDLMICSAVSRRWYYAATRPHLWQRPDPDFKVIAAELPFRSDYPWEAGGAVKTLQRLGYTRQDLTEDDLHRLRSIEQYSFAAAAFQNRLDRLEEHDRTWSKEQHGGPMTCFRQICIGYMCGPITLLLGFIGLTMIHVALSRGTQLTLDLFIPLLIILGLGGCTALQMLCAPDLRHIRPGPRHTCLDSFRVLVCGYSELPWNTLWCNLLIPWAGDIQQNVSTIRRLISFGSLGICASGLLFILKLLDSDEIRHDPEDPWTRLDGLSFTGIAGIFSLGFFLQMLALIKKTFQPPSEDYLFIICGVWLPLCLQVLLVCLKLDGHIGHWATALIPVWLILLGLTAFSCFVLCVSDAPNNLVRCATCCGWSLAVLAPLLFVLKYSEDLVPAWSILIPLFAAMLTLCGGLFTAGLVQRASTAPVYGWRSLLCMVPSPPAFLLYHQLEDWETPALRQSMYTLLESEREARGMKATEIV